MIRAMIVLPRQSRVLVAALAALLLAVSLVGVVSGGAARADSPRAAKGAVRDQIPVRSSVRFDREGQGFHIRLRSPRRECVSGRRVFMTVMTRDGAEYGALAARTDRRGRYVYDDSTVDARVARPAYSLRVFAPRSGRCAASQSRPSGWAGWSRSAPRPAQRHRAPARVSVRYDAAAGRTYLRVRSKRKTCVRGRLIHMVVFPARYDPRSPEAGLVVVRTGRGGRAVIDGGAWYFPRGIAFAARTKRCAVAHSPFVRLPS